MRDQRAGSRSWKWIAFWGGVFTFVAAALLAGILAATGVIMSKSEPSVTSSNSLIANMSDTGLNDTWPEDFELTPRAEDNDRFPMDTSHFDIDLGNDTSHPFITDVLPTEELFPNTDFGNSLENGFPSSQSDTVHSSQGPHPTSFLEPIPEGPNNTMAEPATPTTSASHHDVHLSSTPPGRARSLDKEVPFVVSDSENATLFPAMDDNIFTAGDDMNVQDDINVHSPHLNDTSANTTSSTNLTATSITSLNNTMTPINEEETFGWTSTPLVSEETNEESSMNFGIVPTNATTTTTTFNTTVHLEHNNSTQNETEISILANQTSPKPFSDAFLPINETTTMTSHSVNTVSTNGNSTIASATTGLPVTEHLNSDDHHNITSFESEHENSSLPIEGARIATGSVSFNATVMPEAGNVSTTTPPAAILSGNNESIPSEVSTTGLPSVATEAAGNSSVVASRNGTPASDNVTGTNIIHTDDFMTNHHEANSSTKPIDVTGPSTHGTSSTNSSSSTLTPDVVPSNDHPIGRNTTDLQEEANVTRPEVTSSIPVLDYVVTTIMMSREEHDYPASTEPQV